jgi:putative phage-type endonuclease
MDRTEFLLRRKSGIGGSDVAAIMGVSKYRNAYDVWRDKTSSEVSENNSSVLKIASYLEQYAAQEYEAATGYKVRRKNSELVNADYPFLKGNIDRQILLDKKRGVGILECKALSTYNFRNVKMHGLPADYICQMQHYFLCGNGMYLWGAFAIVNRDSGELLTFEVYPDKQFHKEEIRICVPFWTECVAKNIPPVIEAAAENKVSIAPAYNGIVTDDAELNTLAEQRMENAALVDEAKALLAQTDALIAEKLGDYEAVDCKGARIYYKSTTRTGIDAVRLKKEKPEIYKEFSKTTETSRSLRFYAKDNSNRANF